MTDKVKKKKPGIELYEDVTFTGQNIARLIHRARRGDHGAGIRLAELFHLAVKHRREIPARLLVYFSRCFSSIAERAQGKGRVDVARLLNMKKSSHRARDPLITMRNEGMARDVAERMAARKRKRKSYESACAAVAEEHHVSVSTVKQAYKVLKNKEGRT